jgi:hypothetical protein
MNRGRFIACAALAAALAASCGGEKGGDEGRAAVEPQVPPRAEPAQAPEAAPPAAPSGERIAGKAVAASASGAGTESALALALGGDGRLGGELELGGARCAIAGMVEEAVARAWLTCPAAGGASAKRGTLVGEVAGGKYGGTFAVSDDGAAEVIRGTWTAAK